MSISISHTQRKVLDAEKDILKVKVSVVMTVFNGERHIREAIESILNQTFRNFEFIIIDDDSTDNTAKIISSYTDERIVYIKNERNLGQTKSLNIALTESDGEYVARMDADDIAFPERLEKQVIYFQAHSDVAVVGSWRVDIDEYGKKKGLFKLPTDPQEIQCYLVGSGDLSFWCISHPTVLIRKAVLMEVGFYNEEKGEISGYPQDYELWMRVSPKFKFGNIDEPLLQYRILKHSDSRIKDQLPYRLEITLSRIKKVLPELSEDDAKGLATMLEFRRQESSVGGAVVFDLFDRYFDALIPSEEGAATAGILKKKMKFYYLPQLFNTNKGLVFRHFLSMIKENPIFLFDGKFYRKIGKAIYYNVSK